MPLPELSLRGCAFGGLGGELRVGVNLREREMAEDKTNVIAHLLQQLFKDGIGPAAVGALEVAVFHERHNPRGICADVVAAVGDRKRKISFSLFTVWHAMPPWYRALQAPEEFHLRRGLRPL